MSPHGPRPEDGTRFVFLMLLILVLLACMIFRARKYSEAQQPFTPLLDSGAGNRHSLAGVGTRLKQSVIRSHPK